MQSYDEHAAPVNFMYNTNQIELSIGLHENQRSVYIILNDQWKNS